MSAPKIARSVHAVGLALMGAVTAAPGMAAESDGGRRIEEVVVTAERRESTVQDTAISITALNSEFIEDFGLRNQEDLQNYVPATQIQPYDVTIRGIGRLFRTLGGDPGVSTYLNGVYSEDFGIASTEGGLYDIERVEVLRGPQGTLYGRNGVGGAINFINQSPTPEFGGEIRVIGGDFGLFETYGTVNTPVIEDVLSARFVGSKRRRDGYIDDTGPFESSINNYGDENYALSLSFTPTDTISSYLRVNERSYRRKFNGGAGTSPIVTSQNGGPNRVTDVLAFGHQVLFNGGVATGAVDDPNIPNETFTFNGITRIAERIRPGIDSNGGLDAACDPDGVGGGFSFVGCAGTINGATSANATLPNYAFGLPSNSPLLSQPKDLEDLDSDDLEVATNGQYDEFFDHQALAFNIAWDINDTVTVKYIGGYTDYFYDRDTDEDKSAATSLGSYDFYVLQENENWQHELQLFLDFDKLTITSGIFAYDAHIDQRLDLYDPIDTQGRFQQDTFYPGQTPEAVTGTLAFLRTVVGLNFYSGESSEIRDVTDAQRAFEAGQIGFAGDNSGTAVLLGPWRGDVGTSLRSGSVTDGSFFQWDNIQDTEAKAIYTQLEWDFADQWALTLGGRYAEDKKKGQERIFTYLEIPGFLFLGGGSLQTYNTLSGALDADGNPTGAAPVRFNGLPLAFVSYLPLDDEWDKITWRANIDYQPNDDILIYASATTGWRSGGFNLGFRSTNNPVYDEEDVISYEVGFKGQLFDGTLQLNTSAYYYDYEEIQQIVNVLGQFGAGTAVTNAPAARTIGWEGDILWLPSENLTLGGNWSYTNAEFSDDYLTIDNDDPAGPASVFSPAERTINADGNKLTNIPEWKFVLYGDYVIPLGANGSVDVLTSVSWTDEFFFNFNNSDFDKAPDAWRWDASATWTSPSEKVLVRAFVNNITDQLGIREQQRFGELTGGFLRAGTTNDPRTYGLELRWKFGEF